MNREMSGEHERAVLRALDEYSETLRAERPSAALDARLDSTIGSWAKEQRSHSTLRRPLPWAIGAASIAVIAGGIALLAANDHSTPAYPDTLTVATSPFPALPVSAAVSPLAAGGQVSLYPAEGAVFRVKASLASAVVETSEPRNQGERQYWVDVRIANDGTMRIMQVLPAEHSRVVPLE